MYESDDMTQMSAHRKRESQDQSSLVRSEVAHERPWCGVGERGGGARYGEILQVGMIHTYTEGTNSIEQ
jgi:hypothetical protein